ncbi:uncharacterized protein NECHADRAFT_51206 [Fusarium vanettenii 77-13-4]|uniref:Uncharacterized protein n=1 Tax=Fusarium vanettenii (strain ATCC MYA-4622 / CBS 123669 / FGSC 9596 / NRRL 45880 / 77-13-4) TaxID=660122 RepID=C7ZKP8_FUSV7|nr:uncharacterized protein NECHADRAFT_51206 [Fusarium vanettenii 77-13-4]EEU35482.1 hypothetical protein NECHADRAFT_51206 [Fusarium vanettenii 77-13-4]
MQAVSTEEAPSPFPQFSQAIKYNGLVFCSGNVGLIPGTDLQLVEGTVKDRAMQTLKNLEAILTAAGSSLHNVVKVNIYITDMQNFDLINEAYDEFFTWSPKPARTCVAVHQLPLGTDVEMECTAFLNEGQ